MLEQGQIIEYLYAAASEMLADGTSDVETLGLKMNWDLLFGRRIIGVNIF